MSVVNTYVKLIFIIVISLWGCKSISDVEARL